MTRREVLLAALDALETGDVAEAAAVLLDELQEPPSGPWRFACGCGNRFEFPGQLEDHIFATGHERPPKLTRAA